MDKTQITQYWSADNEVFNYEGLGELLDSNDELQPGNVVYVGDGEPVRIKHLCDADDVLDLIGERAYDIAGEHAEDCADVSAEAKAELNVLLNDWIQKHCNLNFWTIKNVKEYMLTAADFEAAPATDKDTTK